MSIEIWLIFVVVSLIPAISPEPAVFLTIKNSVKHGPRPTLYSATGNALGLAILGYVVSFGLGVLTNTSVILFNCIKFIGAAYLIYLGVRVWKDKSIGRTQTQVTSDKTPGFKLFLEGLIISVTNPKAIAVLASIFPSFLTNPSLLFLQASILSITYAGLCFINHMFLISFAATLQSTLNKARNLAIFRRVLGVTFISFGLGLAFVSRS